MLEMPRCLPQMDGHTRNDGEGTAVLPCVVVWVAGYSGCNALRDEAGTAYICQLPCQLQLSRAVAFGPGVPSRPLV